MRLHIKVVDTYFLLDCPSDERPKNRHKGHTEKVK